MHGETLAIIYPEFTRYTYEDSIEKFANMGRILNPELNKLADERAAEMSCEEIDKFLDRIEMTLMFSDLKVSEEELSAIADDSVELPDL